MSPRAPRPFPSPASQRSALGRSALAPACAALLACIAVPAPAAAQTVTLNRGGQDVRITVNDAATLPEDFPPDVALPVPYTVVRVERSGKTLIVVVTAPGTVDGEAARLRTAMPAGGWAAGSLVQPQAGVGQAWVKGDRVVLAWLTPGDAGGVRLQLQLMPR